MSKYHPPEPSLQTQPSLECPSSEYENEKLCTIPRDIIKNVHLVVLVHGFIGCPADLGYVRHALERYAALALQENDKNDHFFLIHNCQANHGKTWDGVQAGADRVTEEIRHVLRSIQDHFDGLEEVSFSMLGYSLGGMYARAALANIFPLDESTSCPILKLKPKVFCTLATPHLGSQGHTYIRLPSLLEKHMGKVSQTPRDLFQHNSLLEDMVNEARFVQPLLRFEKRIAYTNTHAMDVMVPTSTAAFLSDTSKSVHYYKASQQHACMALVVETPAKHASFSDPTFHELGMSQKLDAMGWTKVFVDFLDCDKTLQTMDGVTLEGSQEETSYTSAELLARFGKAKRQLFVPRGHDLLAVNSKNVLYSYVMKRGRPLVDQLAKDLINDILHGPSEKAEMPPI